MRRLGQIPHWQKAFLYGSFFSCSLSGILYLLHSELAQFISIPSSRIVLMIHGITGGLMLIVFGILLTAHFRAGWLAKNNRLTGVLQLISLVILIVTAYLLYYGSGSIRDIVLTVHEVFGLLFVFFFGCHLAFRKNSRKTNQNMASISLRTR